MTLAEFYDLLEKHDWFYMMSDDPSVYQSGIASSNNLARIAKESKAHQRLYNNYSKHMFSGAAYKTRKHPKPRKPDATE